MVNNPDAGDAEVAYPRLHHVLTTYFPSAALGRESREPEFMAAYAERGEDDPEFAGLAAELRQASREPMRAAPMVNEDLGIQLSPLEVRVNLKDLLDRLMGEEPEVDYTESEEFPQLQQVLLTYFPSTSGRRNRTIAFLRAYAEHGEQRAEFAGLADELRQAVKFPKRAQPVVNEALGLDLTVQEVRSELAGLLDQLVNPDADVEEDAEPEPPSAQELLQGWFFRKVNPIPGKGRKYYFPLWTGLLAGILLAAVGAGILTYLPVPSFLAWLPVTAILAGFVIVLMFSVTMRSLREEMRNPERAEEREAAIAEAELKRVESQQRRRRITRMLGP